MVDNTGMRQFVILAIQRMPSGTKIVLLDLYSK
jgi:hypothetical protein